MVAPKGADQFYGKGLNSLFPEGGSEVTTIPFPAAGRRKDRDAYDKDLVHKTLANPVSTEQFDPRTLHATQPGVTRGGVAHYMDPSNQGLYANAHEAGNQHPVIYSRKDCVDCPETHMLLSGHHRATAALLQGRQLTGVRVQGGWGREYNK